jgi:hypothetical protein
VGFSEGDRVEPRTYVVRDDPRLAGRAGTVLEVEPRGTRTNYVVRWDGIEVEVRHSESGLKPSKLPAYEPAPHPSAVVDEEPADRGADAVLGRETANSDGIHLPGDPGYYGVVFRSSRMPALPDDVERRWTGTMEVYGDGQTDAALRASKQRDLMIRGRKRDGEANPHDPVMRTIFVRPRGV